MDGLDGRGRLSLFRKAQITRLRTFKLSLELPLVLHELLPGIGNFLFRSDAPMPVMRQSWRIFFEYKDQDLPNGSAFCDQDRA